MTGIYIALNRLLDLTLAPFAGLHPLWPLGVWSAVMGVCAMLIYKYTSRQDGIRDAKEKIKGHFFEVFLYIDDAATIAKAQARIMLHAARYLAYAMPPLLIMVALFFPLFANFETRYAMRPLAPGQEALVKVAIKKHFDGWQDEIKLNLPAGLSLAAPPVRFVRKHYENPEARNKKVNGRDFEADFRVRVDRPGPHVLGVSVRGKELQVPLACGSYGDRAAPFATAELGTALLYPPLAAPPASSPLLRVQIEYPAAEFPVGPWRMWWVWPFLVVSMIAAYAVKGVFKVEI